MLSHTYYICIRTHKPWLGLKNGSILKMRIKFFLYQIVISNRTKVFRTSTTRRDWSDDLPPRPVVQKLLNPRWKTTLNTSPRHPRPEVVLTRWWVPSSRSHCSPRRKGKSPRLNRLQQKRRQESSEVVGAREGKWFRHPRRRLPLHRKSFSRWRRRCTRRRCRGCSGFHPSCRGRRSRSTWRKRMASSLPISHFWAMRLSTRTASSSMTCLTCIR